MILPHLQLERSLWQSGLQAVAGLDEAGRGAWCGPVAAAAVILPAHDDVLQELHGVRDSKLMNARQRAIWADRIKSLAVSWQIGFSSHEEIDTLGILPATRLAMQRAISGLDPQPNFLLIDAVKLVDSPLPQKSIIRGDQQSLSIAAASILAKTARDALLVQYSQQYPHYGFEMHKGYGTKKHQQALLAFGPCEIHRRSFAPIRRVLELEDQPTPQKAQLASR